jgi:hypothetical protein
MSEELSKRVEALTGPCRETDAEIGCAVHFVPDKAGCDWARSPNWRCAPFKQGRSVYVGYYDGEANSPTAYSDPPAFTASLDAAMTLVPEGCSWDVGNSGPDCGPWACVTTAGEVDHGVHAATPALALTAAALYAREAAE